MHVVHRVVLYPKDTLEHYDVIRSEVVGSKMFAGMLTSEKR